SGVIVLMGAYDGAVSIVSMATDDVVKKGIHAGNIIKEIAPLVDGRGGGKPTMAQAGGKNIEGIDKALEKAKEVIEGMIC
ncbi:MAG: DHHA1 domain-containing protein, partial [Defluviitaleaceae bacterium]|nr:DHHA1 domain-containing protein [Defluviitaleaceae bacterium]